MKCLWCETDQLTTSNNCCRESDTNAVLSKETNSFDVDAKLKAIYTFSEK